MKKKINNIIYIFMLLQPVLDIITSLMTRFLDMRITLGIVVRGTIFLVSLIYIFFFAKSKYKKISKIYILLLGLFSIIYFVTKPSLITNMSFFIGEVIYMFKYYYTLIIFMMMLNLFDDLKTNNRILFRLLHVELFLYCFSIVLANVTGTAFGTYEGGSGNTGWFYAGNEIGIITALLFPFIFLIINKTKSYKVLFYIIPIVLGIEIIGTKTSMLGLLLPTIIFFGYYLIRIKDKSKQFVMTLIILLIIVISSPNLPVVQNIQNSLARFNNRLQHKEEIDEDYSDDAMSSVLLSDRDYYHRKTKKIYDKASNVDKLFGLGFSNRKEIDDKNIEKLIEMDFHDVFYHYGIIGFILYCIPFIWFTYNVIKLCFIRKFKLNIKQLLLGYVSYIGFVISFMCGHVLGAPAVSFYMCISMVLLLYYLNNEYYQVELVDNKITIMALHLGVGGIEKYLSSLCKILENNYDIELVSTYKINDKPSFEFSDKIKIKYLMNTYPHKEEFKDALKNRNIVNILKEGFNLFKVLLLKYLKNIMFIEEVDSKYIITTRDFHNRLVSGNKNRDTIAIATEHNYHNNDKKYIKKLVDSCDNIDYLVLVSEELKDFYSEKLKNTKTKCIYIPNVIDNIPKYESKKKVNNKLVAVGRLVEEKGFDDLIDIISIIKKDIPNIKLDIYGDGSLKNDLNNKIKELDLEDNIKLCGFYPFDKLVKKLNDYDLYLMTSHTESFGLVLIEAMSRSVPCIGFDNASGVKKLLDNGNGILISNRDKELYAKEVVSLLNNLDEINKLSKKGYESINKYDISVVKKQWLSILK